MVKIKKKIVRGNIEYLRLSGVKPDTKIKDVEKKYKGDLRHYTDYSGKRKTTMWYIRRKKRGK